MEALFIFLLHLAWVLVLILVHESGHYLAGWIGGIPARDMRIRMFCFPQHVQLRDADQWVSPVADIDAYIKLVWRHLKSTPLVYVFVSGGFLVETIFTLAASVPMIAAGWPKIAIALNLLSLLMLLPWVCIDMINICRGRIGGDLSGLWFLARLPTAIFVFALLLARGIPWWLAAASRS